MATFDISPAASPLYRAVWRWHFIAGLIVLPVLVMMAVTGGLYLFKPELDHLAYRPFEDVAARAAPLVSADTVVAKVEAATGGQVLQYTTAEPGQSIRLLVRAPNGKALTAFADPYDGRLIGATHYGGIMQLVRKVHSLQKFGFWASCIIEIAAGWAIVMVATGVFLWWPRGRGGVVSVRGAPRQRVFWRDLHAITGAFSAAVILFLAVTGMPWSMFWGDHVQKWATAANLYEPAPPAKVTPNWMLTMDMPGMQAAKPDRPWALEAAPQPMSKDMPMDMTGMDMSRPMAGMRHGFDLETAIRTFDAYELKRPYTVTLPDGPRGAYAADYRPDRVEDSRTVYLDQYSGRRLGDVGFRDWGPAAKAIEWGIAVHQGQEYGPANRYLMLAGCLAIVLLAVSAVVMWWKRRPRGELGVPPAPTDRRVAWAVLGVVAVVGVLYPLVGASLIVALALERLYGFARARTKQQVGAA